jgi:fucose permease
MSSDQKILLDFGVLIGLILTIVFIFVFWTYPIQEITVGMILLVLLIYVLIKGSGD